MIGRIRFPVNREILCLVEKQVSKKTNNFVYSIDYAYKYCHIMLPEVPADKIKMYYMDENKNTLIHSEPIESIWNMLRASYIQEHLLNNRNSNIMTTFKMLIESNGDIYEEEYDDEVPKIKVDSKTYSERVVETKTPTSKEYLTLSKKNKNDLTEEHIMAMTKYQLKQKQNLSDTTPEEIINECIKLYIENEREINTSMRVNKKQNRINTYAIKEKDIADELTIEKHKHFKVAYDKTVETLECKYTDKTKTIKATNFDEKFKNVEYTQVEILSLDSRGIMKNKFQIVKAFLSRCGISLISQSTRAYENKKRVRVINYVLNRDEKIYSIIYNIVANNEDEYDDSFVLMLKSYDKYQNYVINNPKKNQQPVKQHRSMFKK